MTREDFIARLRAGLKGVRAETVADIVADYEAHFAEASAAGRSEAAVAEALGDPGQLARELRVEAGLKRWEVERSPAAAAAAFWALLGLGALSIIILSPLLLALALTIFAFGLTAVIMVFVGIVVLVGGPFAETPGGPVGAVLLGVNMIGFGVATMALTMLAAGGLGRATAWWVRVHFRLLRPRDDRTEASVPARPWRVRRLLVTAAAGLGVWAATLAIAAMLGLPFDSYRWQPSFDRMENAVESKAS